MNTYDIGPELIKKIINMGYPIIVGWNEWGGHWSIIIGYDEMGSSKIEDDILILADPYDRTDSLEDGYYIRNLYRFCD